MTPRELVALAAGFAAAACVYLWPLVRRIGSAVAVDVNDPYLNAWIIAWGADRLPYGLQGFWSPPVLYPYPNTAAYSENLLGITIFVAPVYWISANPFLTHNVALILSYAVAGLGAYVLTRELTGRRDAALIAACGFAFAPYRWAQLTHLQVLFVGWLLFALFAAHRLSAAPSRLNLAGLTASLLLLAFSNGYAAYQAAIAVPIVVAWCAVRYRLAWKDVRRFAIAAGIMAVVIAPAVLPHLRVWSGRNPFAGDFARYSADLGSYLDVPPELPLAGWLPGVAEAEGRLFPGLVIAVLALAALAPGARPGATRSWTGLYALLAVLGIVMSLGPEPRAWGRPLPIPPVYAWSVDILPLFHALRVPARFGTLALTGFCVLAAIGAARLLAGMPRRRGAAVTAAFCAVILLEGYGGPVPLRDEGFTFAPDDTSSRQWLAQQPRGPVLDLPASAQSVRPMTYLYQFGTLVHHQPTMGGASRIQTPLQIMMSGSASPLANPALLQEAVPFLQGLGVRYLTIRPGFYQDPALAEALLATLDASGAARRVTEFGGVLIYTVDDDPAPDPVADLEAVPPDALVLTASVRSETAPLAVDGDPDTRWISGAPQSGSEWLAIEFDRPRNIGRLDLYFSERSFRDYPRNLEIVATGFGDPPGERVLYAGSVLRQLGAGVVRSPGLPAVSIDLPDYWSTRLVLRQRGRAQPWFWSVDEMTLFERASSRP